MDSQTKSGSNKRLIIIFMAVIILLLAVIVVVLLLPRSADTTATPPDAAIDDPDVPMIGYAQGVTVVDNEEDLQAAVDKMFEDAEREMVVSYKPQAVSEDGVTFDCYIANSEYNEYDMYIALYSDMSGESDPLFLSGLMRPGEAFKEITLDGTLDKGNHTVYLVMTQVEDDHATLHGQSTVTLQMQVV